MGSSFVCSFADEDTESSVSGQQHAPKTTSHRPSRPPFPATRAETYQNATEAATTPIPAHSITTPRTTNGAKNPAMSFIDVHMSESMLHPATPSPTSARPVTRLPLTEHDGTRRASVAGNTGTTGYTSIADGLETTNRMFEILSARSDIDHPICVECTELLVEGLQKRLGVATRERDAYIDYLRRANTDVPSADEVKAAQASLKAAHQAEAAAIANLEKLELEKADLDRQLIALEAESRQLDQEENDFWKTRNAFNTTLTEFQNERDALSTRYAHDAQILNQLQRRSVYNDSFNITHDNHFATINALRLGRLPSPYVDWPEINAAWGQTCLLLATLAERLGYKFQGYELSPMGSTSTITRLEVKATDAQQQQAPNTPTSFTRHRLELYSSGDFPINFGFLHRKFDTAMVAFLECLRQLGEFVENTNPHISTGAGTTTVPGSLNLTGQSPGVKMPYEIRKDKIHDQSIKLALNKEESWTKACKYTLTCCKYLLAHANNVESLAMKRAR